MGNDSLFTGNKTSSYLWTLTTTKKAGKKNNLDSMWKRWMKHAGEPYAIFAQVFFGMHSTYMEAEQKIFDELRKMFESCTSAGTIEKLAGSEIQTKKSMPVPSIWKDMR